MTFSKLDSLVADRPPIARRFMDVIAVGELFSQLDRKLAEETPDTLSIAQTMASIIEQSADKTLIEKCLEKVIARVKDRPNARECIVLIASKTFVNGDYRRICREAWDHLPQPK